MSNTNSTVAPAFYTNSQGVFWALDNKALIMPLLAAAAGGAAVYLFDRETDQYFWYKVAAATAGGALIGYFVTKVAGPSEATVAAPSVTGISLVISQATIDKAFAAALANPEILSSIAAQAAAQAGQAVA